MAQEKKGFFKRLFGGDETPSESILKPDVEAEVEVFTPSEPEKEPLQSEALPETAPEVEVAGEEKGWLARLSSGLARTSSQLSEGISGLFTKARLDGGTLDDLEDLLIQSDLGVETAMAITERLSEGRYEKGIAPEEVQKILAEEVARVLAPVAKPLLIDKAQTPFIILMAGVNGAGKTTTIGKLSAKFAADGHKVMLAAGDTFRAAAIGQLKVWAERTGAQFFAKEQGADAGALAYEAIEAAKASGADVLMIDTAGRLQNRAELMAELEKVIRVIKKQVPDAPHAALLVIDATTGQNALQQTEIFAKTAGITGLVMTKLDGTARGGILVAIARKFALPVHFIGVGEKTEDLQPFAAEDFASAIAGLKSYRETV